jgi:dCTP deaminase
MSGVLCDRQILEEREKGNIFIHPFSDKNLSNSSYDVTLGPYYYRAQKKSGLFLPWDDESVREYWGDSKYADLISDEVTARRFKLPIGSRVIMLEPGELILAHTNEFIGGIDHITTMMKARSSMGRVGISVCKDAGWGDINYLNKWTLELSNFSQATIPLVVGSRIAQIVFFYTGKTSNPYDKNGAYQSKFSTTDEMMQKWTFSDMLPKYRF